MRARATLAGSSISSLARRMAEPSGAISGPLSLAGALTQHGAAVTPAAEAPRMNGGGSKMYTLLSHGSTGGASSVDAVTLGLPCGLLLGGSTVNSRANRPIFVGAYLPLLIYCLTFQQDGVDSASEARRVFDHFDADGSGEIDAAELSAVCSSRRLCSTPLSHFAPRHRCRGRDAHRS
eukprot:SAG11_NODE_338_length_10535_cov_8.199885_10_plen_178_part_00